MLQRIFRPNIAITGADMAAAPTCPSPKSPARGAPLLALLLLAGCSNGGIGSSISSSLDRLWSPFMGSTNVVTSDSLTVQRVRGGNPAVEPLVPEGGDVWPVQEAERPTLLGGPDEAMRNIPVYRPSLIEGAPAASSPVPTPGERPVRRGSSTPPGSLAAPGDFARNPASPAPAGAYTPPPPRLEGRPMTTPSGSVVTGTGGTSRVQGYTGPQGGGAVVRDGNIETWIGPDGQTRTRVVPN
ncbi:hypothetical protein [Falsiroseomonas tokyonensis]|uniref:Uncharacterized protein n=1 Tax=Falsiroseomonas tokyonensis TaxID=430521 RepID=A0ABV7BZ22_9PROT|nr:hypothetical protein [Falsiroseomonas tokyonensis]MBU8539714.1 hypothetical protein [Falsiroseomonas tokyonensis]